MRLTHLQRAQQIFDAVVELPAAQQPQAIARACGDDAALRQLVEELVGIDQEQENKPFAGFSAPKGLSSGQRFGKYVIEEPLGRGGMAEVWAVRHVVLETRSALKVLLHAAPQLQERLLREGRAQARLQHRNIVPVRDVLNVDGVPGLLMPLIEGPSLEALLQQQPDGKGLPVAKALYLMVGIADGVHYAHQSGLVHRDLKPANVLLDQRDGQFVPRIADFGLVKSRGADNASATRDGVLMGTPAYAAPEQLQDAAQAGPAADIFSLGVLFCELLTGQLPFRASSVYELLIAQRAPPELHGVPADLQPLLREMLHVAPAQRPTSGALLARLAALPSPSESTLQLFGRRPRGSALSGLTPSGQSNLPPQRDRFVGRQDELARLDSALGSGERLITVVGTGGVGKTRLVREAGRKQAEREVARWPGGVWFCDLASARDLPAMLSAVGQTLRLKLGAEPLDTITAALQQRGRCLLILDNLEQLLSEAVALIGRLYDDCEAVFLCTSRSPLRMRGEQALRLDPMDGDAGAALFLERARVVNEGFSPTPGEREQIRRLVEMLDGLPLAIELAAARSRLSPPQKLLKRLSKRFKLLSSTAPDRPRRQQTLRATIQWSWELLSPIEQAALAQCSTFAGRFSLEAAEAIVDLSDHEDDPWIEDVLSELVDKSLLLSHHGRAPRLSMLVSVREFATAQVPEQAAVEARHSAWFSRPIAQPASADRADLVLACERATASSAAAVASRCAINASLLFNRRGPAAEGLRLMTAVDERFGDANPHRSELCRSLAEVLQITGQSEAALVRAQQACDIAEARQDARELRRSLSKLGGLLRHNERFHEAEQTLQRALQAARDAGDEAIRGRIYQDIAGLHWARSDIEEALAALHQALRINRAHGNQEALASTLNNLGVTLQRSGRNDEARAAYEEGLAVVRALGDRRTEAHLLFNLGEIYWALGAFEKVRQCFEDALEITRVIGERGLQSSLLLVLGDLHLQNGDLDAAEALFSESLAMAEQMQNARNTGLVHQSLAALHAQRGQLDAALSAIEAAVAISRQLEDIFSECLQLNKRAHIQAEHGQPADAIASARAGLSLAEAIGRVELVALSQADLARLLAQHSPARDEARSLLALARAAVEGRGLPETSQPLDAIRKAAAALGGGSTMP